MAAVSFALKMHRFSLAALCLNLALFLFIGSGIFPRILLEGLQTHQQLSHPKWKENNLIILLGSGAIEWSDKMPENKSKHVSAESFAYSRIHEATRLYYDCKAHSSRCRILISGGDAAGIGISEALVMLNELQEVGVKTTDIITETQSLNTFQNARFSSELIHKDNFDRLLLVTSGTHMRRSLLLFSYFNIEPVPAPADHLSVRTSSWKYLYYNFFVTDLSLHEYIGRWVFQFSE